MLRRSAQSLLPRLFQANGSALSPLATAVNHLPSVGPQRDDKPGASSLFARHHSDLAAHTGGLPATIYAMKNPTPAIRYDDSNHDQFAPGGDESKRAFTYFVLTGGRFIGAAAVRLAVLKFVLSMTATKDVLAMANLEVNIGNIQPGNEITVKWRGKPVFIRHRTPEEISEAEGTDVTGFRDPQTDAERVIDPKYLVVVGVCTHLGCVPIAGAGDYNGWFCPCHGTHYDISGRVRRGPAPYNLEVPEYRFLNDDHTKAVIG